MFLFQKQNFHFLDERRKQAISLITQTERAMKELFVNKDIIECRFILKLVLDMIITHS